MSIELNFGTEDEPRFLALEARAASMQAADDLQATSAKLVEIGTKLEEEIIKLEEKSSPKTAPALEQKRKEYRETVFSVIVSSVQIIVRRNNLTTEDKAIFDQDSRSAFWRMQEVEAMKQFAQNFRANLI